MCSMRRAEAIDPTGADEFVFLGDLVERSRQSRRAQSHPRTAIGLPRGAHPGNHEEMMLAARSGAEAFNYWQNCGGALTLSSYHFPGRMEDVTAEHWVMIESCLPYYETDDLIFTHANYLPNMPTAAPPPIAVGPVVQLLKRCGLT